MSYETIRYDVDGGIATLTLARPDRHNSVNSIVLREIVDVCDRVDADDAVRALIVTGEGRTFCAGADLSRGADSFADPKAAAFRRADGSIDYTHPQARDGGGFVTLRFYKLLKPLIVAINGPAIGLGVSMILPADVRIASRTARFGFAFAARGLVPESMSSFFLPRIVGISRALEWCMAARMVSAEDALAAGLVRSVVEPDELMPMARALAAEFAANAPVSVALTRQLLWRGLEAAHPMETHRADSRAVAARSFSRDVAEGVTAWKDKRAPDFPERISTDMPDFFPWWEEPEYR